MRIGKYTLCLLGIVTVDVLICLYCCRDVLAWQDYSYVESLNLPPDGDMLGIGLIHYGVLALLVLLGNAIVHTGLLILCLLHRVPDRVRAGSLWSRGHWRVRLLQIGFYVVAVVVAAWCLVPRATYVNPTVLVVDLATAASALIVIMLGGIWIAAIFGTSESDDEREPSALDRWVAFPLAVLLIVATALPPVFIYVSCKRISSAVESVQETGACNGSSVVTGGQGGPA